MFKPINNLCAKPILSLQPTKLAYRNLIIQSVAVAALLCLGPKLSQAAPSGGTVTAGSADISTSGKTTTVLQDSARAVIAWDGFNLASDESVNFIVPSSSDATLNRISDPHPSRISGTITSNGTVYFSNPNGLIFDAASRVTANGFVATTADISAGRFMNSPLAPNSLSAKGSSVISLAGSITAPTVTVVAPYLAMSGTITSAGGSVHLSSSSYSSIGKTAVISTTGIGSQNGGSVMVWSDGFTDFYGTIQSRGGSSGGNGGAVEVSGSSLRFNGLVDVSAPQGTGGSFILDPIDIHIVTAANLPASGDTTAGSDSADADASNDFTALFTRTATTSYVTVESLNSSFGSNNGNGSAVIKTTDGKIFVDDALAWTGTGSLTLDATSGISLKAGITAASGGLVIKSYGSNVTVDSGLSFSLKSLDLNLGSGQFILKNTSLTAKTITVNSTATIATASDSTGDSSLTASSIFTFNNGTKISLGNSKGLNLTAHNSFTLQYGTFNRIDSGSGVLTLASNGTITVKGIVAGYGNLALSASKVFLGGTGTNSITGGTELAPASLHIKASSGVFLKSGFSIFHYNSTITTDNLILHDEGVFTRGYRLLDNRPLTLRSLSGAAIGFKQGGSQPNGSLLTVTGNLTLELGAGASLDTAMLTSLRNMNTQTSTGIIINLRGAEDSNIRPELNSLAIPYNATVNYIASGSGSLTLTGTADYSGGRVSFSGNGIIATASTITTSNSGSVDFTSRGALNFNSTLGSNSLKMGSVSAAGAVTITTIGAAGSLTISSLSNSAAFNTNLTTDGALTLGAVTLTGDGDFSVTTGSSSNSLATRITRLVGNISNSGGSVNLSIWNSLEIGDTTGSNSITITGKSGDSSKSIDLNAMGMVMNQNLITTGSVTKIKLGDRPSDATSFNGALNHNNRTITSSLDLSFSAGRLSTVSTAASVFIVTAGDFILPTSAVVTPAATVGIYSCADAACVAPTAPAGYESISQWWYLDGTVMPTSTAGLNRVNSGNLPTNLIFNQINVTAGKSNGVTIPQFTDVVVFKASTGNFSGVNTINLTGNLKLVGSNQISKLVVSGSATTDIALTLGLSAGVATNSTNLGELKVIGSNRIFMLDQSAVESGRGTLAIGKLSATASTSVILDGSEVTIGEITASTTPLLRIKTKGALVVNGAITTGANGSVSLISRDNDLQINADIGDAQTDTVTLETISSHKITIGSNDGKAVTIKANSTTDGFSANSTSYPIKIVSGSLVLNQDLNLNGGKAYLNLGSAATGTVTTNGKKIITDGRDLFLGAATVTTGLGQATVIDLGSSGWLSVRNSSATPVTRNGSEIIYIYGGTKGSATRDNGKTIVWKTFDEITATNLPTGLFSDQIVQKASNPITIDTSNFIDLVLFNLDKASSNLTVNATGSVRLIGNNKLGYLNIITATSVTAEASSVNTIGTVLIGDSSHSISNGVTLNGSFTSTTITIGAVTSGGVTVNGSNTIGTLTIGVVNNNVSLSGGNSRGSKLQLGAIGGDLTLTGNFVFTTITTGAVGGKLSMIGNNSGTSLTIGEVSGAVTLTGNNSFRTVTITKAASVDIKGQNYISDHLLITQSLGTVTLGGVDGTWAKLGTVDKLTIGAATDVIFNQGNYITGAASITNSGALKISGLNSFESSLTVVGASSVAYIEDATQNACQQSDSCFSVSGRLDITSTGAITLYGDNNYVQSLGTLIGGGVVKIKTKNSMVLNDDITTVGGLTLTAGTEKSTGNITLRNDIIVTGGKVTLEVSNSEVFKAVKYDDVNRSQIIGNYTLSSSGNDIDISAGDIDAVADQLVFKLVKGANIGTLTMNIGGRTTYDRTKTAYIYDKDGPKPTIVGVDAADIHSSKDLNRRGINLAQTDLGLANQAKMVGSAGIDFSQINLVFYNVNEFDKISVTAASVKFKGINQFRDLSITTLTGSVTQFASTATEVTSLIVSGAGSFTSAGSVILTNGSNSFSNLSSLTGTVIDLAASNQMIVSGAITATGAVTLTNLKGGITVSDTAAIRSGGSLTLTAGAGIAFSADSVTVSGASSDLILSAGSGNLEFSNSRAVTVGRNFILSANQGSIALTSSAAITASGALTLTAASGISLNSSATVSATSLKFTAQSLTLGASFTSQDGAVVINLGKGSYNNNLTSGFVWTTTNQDLSITLGLRRTKAGTVFNLGSGNFTQAYQSPLVYDQPILIYRSVDPMTEGYLRYSLAEANQLFDQFTSGSSVTTTGTVNSLSDRERSPFVQSYNVWIDGLDLRDNRQPLSLTVGAVTIMGNNSFGQTGLTIIGQVILADDATMRGNLMLGTADSSLTLGNGVRLTGGSISNSANADLRLNFSGYYSQSANDSRFDAGDQTLILKGGSGAIRLNNPNNRFQSLAVTTAGASLSLVSNQDLTFTALSTGGGSVNLVTSGSIVTSNPVMTGGLNFKASGSVVVVGKIASINGTAQSVSVTNGAAGMVIGTVTADGAITLDGTGSGILVGQLNSLGGGAITVDLRLAAVGTVAVNSNGGIITIGKALDSLVSSTPAAVAANLELNAGNGFIRLEAPLGAVQSLGWVKLVATSINNPLSHRIVFSKGSATPDGLVSDGSLSLGR
ncbi:MAG: filamentous hemagglutinin N-terminal domain-containing protein [Candidatus Pacebacteria bacterium]|nr:filamentous hemagglutinin N-terminal domain-containing protein [Candidatus Paceibacterota bacterium]